MLQLKPESNLPRLLTLWVLSTVLGWSLIIYPGLTLRNEIIFSLGMLLPITMKMLVSTLLLGAVIGALQYLFLRSDINIPLQWILISVLSYSIGTVVAFLISSIGISVIFPDVLFSGGATFMPMPLAFIMLTGGFFVGLIQAFAIRNSFAIKKTRLVILWSLGTCLSWGIGFWLTSFGAGINLPLFEQSGLVGLATGLVTALIIGIQVKTNQFSS